MWAPSVVLVFVLSGALALATLVAVWSQRHSTPAARPILLCASGMGVWSTAAMVSALFHRTDATLPLAAVAQVGQSATVSGYLLLAIVIRNRHWRPRWRTLWFAIEPVLAIVGAIAAAGHWSRWFYSGVDEWRPGVWTAALGPLFWVNLVYAYGGLTLATFGILLAGRRPHGDPRGGRWAIAIMSPGAVSTMVAVTVFHYLDLALLGIALSAVVATWAFSQESFQQLLPEARKKVLDTISDGVAVVDPDGRIIHLNPAGQEMVAKLLDGPPGTVNGLHIRALLPEIPLDPAADTEYVYHSERGTDAEVDVRASVIRDVNGRCAGWTLVARDITLIRRQNRELEKVNLRLQSQLEMIDSLRADLAEQAVRDALTGLYNRRHLLAELDGLLRTNERGVSVALVDLDHFKAINDTYGHGTGDDVLVAVAAVLGDRLAGSDVLARYGGEEFVVVLPGRDAEAARAQLDEIRERLAGEPVSAGGLALGVTFSAGVAAAVGPVAAADLIDAADRALYRAKHAGRNRVEVTGSRVSAPA